MKLKQHEINQDELKVCEWEDIKVGEVFGIGGCFEIWYKMSEKKAFEICDDWCGADFNAGFDLQGDIRNYRTIQSYGTKYKLPKSLQKMFVSNLDTFDL